MSTGADNPTLTLDLPAAAGAAPPEPLEDRAFSLLGVRITDVTRRRALALLTEILRERSGPTRCVFFVNAHTLNLAAADSDYREALNAADYVFGDGTGVRWAARLHGLRVRDNLAGTDLVPQLLRDTAAEGYRYFLLGGDEEMIARAAATAAATFPGWTPAGCHHGYLDDGQLSAAAVRQINRAAPDLLLVGMGNPRQEQWIHQHRRELEVPLCLGVGGLFNYWAGSLRRSPRWLRRLGAEWLGILLQQPHKARRYLLGNPLFLYRILRGRACGL
jgi:N-acetylglucosaminyldiphosphoundecaprenol N-acetyl-beta-D-mannosaminyltransferase